MEYRLYREVQLSTSKYSIIYTSAVFTTGDIPTPLPCREDFFREEGSESCVPNCYTWREYSPAEVIVTDVVNILANSVGFIAGLAVVVISLIRFKRM